MMMIHPFDWHRIFIGDNPPLFLLEIAFRTCVLYLFTLLVIRLFGKRIQGQLSPFELILVIALGSSVGDPMMQPEVPLVHGMLVVTVLLSVHAMLGVLKSRLPQFERAAENSSRCVVNNGVLNIKALRKEQIAADEIFMLLRQAGVRQIGEVEVAQLEASGALSVYRFEPAKARPGLALIPPPENFTQAEADTLALASESHVCTVCGVVQPEGHVISTPCTLCEGRRFVATAFPC